MKKTSLIYILLLIGVFSLPVIVIYYFSLVQNQSADAETFAQIPAQIAQPTPKPIVQLNQSVLHNVPFTSQAPFAEWDNDIFQYACEEASLLMAMRWIEEKPLTVEEARTEILAMAEFQQNRTGNFHDTSAADTAQLMRDYFDYQNVEVQYDINTDDIKAELFEGNLVIVPVNGQIVKNPFYTSPPPAHMFVIVGYDNETKEFIVNDPGTRHGQSFRYSESILNAGLQDYPTGRNEPITQVNKVMIIIKPLAI